MERSCATLTYFVLQLIVQYCSTYGITLLFWCSILLYRLENKKEYVESGHHTENLKGTLRSSSFDLGIYQVSKAYFRKLPKQRFITELFLICNIGLQVYNRWRQVPTFIVFLGYGVMHAFGY